MARVLVQWQPVGTFADKLRVYRSASPITSVATLSPIKELPPDRTHFIDKAGLGTWHWAVQPVLEGQVAGAFATVSKTITEHELPQLVSQSHPLYLPTGWTAAPIQVALPNAEPGDLIMVVGHTRTVVGTPLASEFASWNEVAAPTKPNNQRPYMFWKYAEESDRGRLLTLDNHPGNACGVSVLHFTHSKQIKVVRCRAASATGGAAASMWPFSFTNPVARPGLAVCLRETNYAYGNAENYIDIPAAPVFSPLDNGTRRFTSWGCGIPLASGAPVTAPPEGDMRFAVVFRPVAASEAVSFTGYGFRSESTNADSHPGDLGAVLYVEP